MPPCQGGDNGSNSRRPLIFLLDVPPNEDRQPKEYQKKINSFKDTIDPIHRKGDKDNHELNNN